MGPEEGGGVVKTIQTAGAHQQSSGEGPTKQTGDQPEL